MVSLHRVWANDRHVVWRVQAGCGATLCYEDMGTKLRFPEVKTTVVSWSSLVNVPPFLSGPLGSRFCVVAWHAIKSGSGVDLLGSHNACMCAVCLFVMMLMAEIPTNHRGLKVPGPEGVIA